MSSFDWLIAKALDLGAVEARVVGAGEVVVEERVTLKCRFGCPDYGRAYSCPPHAPGVEEFRRALGEYEQVLLVAFPTPAALDGAGTGLQRARHDPESDPAEKARVDRFYADWEKSKASAFAAILELEREAFNAGYPFALALRPGRCTVCGCGENCVARGDCRERTRLRFSPEAVGVNLVATCRAANMKLVFPFVNNPCHISMVLLG